jgi:hypothetical protein
MVVSILKPPEVMTLPPGQMASAYPLEDGEMSMCPVTIMVEAETPLRQTA